MGARTAIGIAEAISGQQRTYYDCGSVRDQLARGGDPGNRSPGDRLNAFGPPSEHEVQDLDDLGGDADDDRVGIEHLQCSLLEFQDHRFDEALAASHAAEDLIGPCGLEDDQQRVDLWLRERLRVRPAVYFWRNELEHTAALIESTRPMVEARGSAETVAYFCAVLAAQHVREQRYRVDSQILEEHRRAVDASRASAAAATTPAWARPEGMWCLAMSELGVALAWHGDFAEAEWVPEQALASAERQGSSGTRGRVLVNLAVTAWRRGDVEAVRKLAPQARATAQGSGLPVLHGRCNGPGGLGRLA
jgi:hypothetical protein